MTGRLARLRRWLSVATCPHEWVASCTWMRGCERPIHHVGRCSGQLPYGERGVLPEDWPNMYYYCAKCDSDGVRQTWEHEVRVLEAPRADLRSWPVRRMPYVPRGAEP